MAEISGPALWHRRLAGLTGQLAICVGKRKLNPAQMREWIHTLEDVKEEMTTMLPPLKDFQE